MEIFAKVWAAGKPIPNPSVSTEGIGMGTVCYSFAQSAIK